MRGNLLQSGRLLVFAVQKGSVDNELIGSVPDGGIATSTSVIGFSPRLYAKDWEPTVWMG
jgi:hypothetical protein